MKNKILFILFAIIMVGCQYELDNKTDAFTLGFIPAERASELTPKAELLANFLEQEMGRKVEIVVPTSYEPLMEGLRFGHIDATFMDSGPGWLAHINSDAEVVLAELKKGEPFYYGEVFVQADSDITSLEEALGKKIAFTSFTGSSGFILPIGTMIKRGLITPEGNEFIDLEAALGKSFDQYIVAGGYEQALTLLSEGKVDVAGGAFDAPEVYLEEGDRKKIKTLERLGKVPSHPIMVGKHVDEETKNAFISAMTKLNDPENVHIIKDLYGVEGVIPTNTQEHLGDFGPAFEALTGIQQKVLEKR